MTDTALNELISKITKDIQQNPNLIGMSDSQLEDLAKKKLQEEIDKSSDTPEYVEFKALTFRDKALITTGIFDGIRGYGVLGQIMANPDVTEVMINGPKDIFVEQTVGGKSQLIKSPITFDNADSLKIVINKIVSNVGRTVDESNPIQDARLNDGSRVNIVLPPVALNGPIVTVRRFPKTAMTIEKLLGYGSITPEVAEVLQLLVYRKHNIFVSGGTGSGKTTFLNALSNFIPRDERIITIEDSAELQIKNIDNIVKLETKAPGSDGTGEITIQMLIKSALRMRPERIIVGEVRGKEALDMLQAMNTGHDGSLSTGHANSAEDMLSRLETMVLQGTAGLPLPAVRQQINSAVDIIVHLSRLRDRSRRTMEISEVERFDPEMGNGNGKVILNPLFLFEEYPESTSDKIIGKLTRTKNPMKNTFKLTAEEIEKINAGI